MKTSDYVLGNLRRVVGLLPFFCLLLLATIVILTVVAEAAIVRVYHVQGAVPSTSHTSSPLNLSATYEVEMPRLSQVLVRLGLGP